MRSFGCSTARRCRPYAQTQAARFNRTSVFVEASYRPLLHDRVGPDGNLRPVADEAAGPLSSSYVIGTPLALPPAPAVPPPSPAQLDALSDFLYSSRRDGGTLVITGAGCSTESDVPDYRGPGGAYSTGFRPMTHQAFMKSPENRSRYWARSFAGWYKFSRVQPNAAHHGIATLQHAGLVSHVITQNVDRLHHRAGSPAVLELHGTTHEVICMTCSSVTPRDEVQRWLARLNPEAAEAAAKLAGAGEEEGGGEDERHRMLRAGTAEPVRSGLKEKTTLLQRPDGDVEIDTAHAQFEISSCPACGGILKPDVVFFGDSLPPIRAQTAIDLAARAPSVLVVGSSLAVWSAFRLIKANVGRARVALVNVGPTRADELAEIKVEARAGDVMRELKTRLAS